MEMSISAGNVSAVLRYGTETAQTLICTGPPPEIKRCMGVAILIHGGYWRARFDASLMNLLVEDLTARGWATANMEYRSVGNGGGWPVTLNDVHSAIDAVTQSGWRRQWGGPTIGVGHSVGGQLALLSVDRLDAVVALAPVTDAIRTYEEGLGENAAAEFFGAAPDGTPGAYTAASPVHQLPSRTPTLIVHGVPDVRVPLVHSLDYIDRAKTVGGQVDLLVLHDLDHMAVIDPSARHWVAVSDWMRHAVPKER